jgi:hypothetical protein
VNTATSPETIAVKNSWKIATGRQLVTLESQFNPSQYSKTDQTFGALSASGQFYSIDLSVFGPKKFKVLDKNLRIGDPTISVLW